MRITLSIDGGLAYLPARNAPRTLDVDALPRPAQDRLHALVDALCETPPANARGSPDARTYTIAIEDGQERKSFRFSDPVNERCAALMDALRAHLP